VLSLIWGFLKVLWRIKTNNLINIIKVREGKFCKKWEVKWPKNSQEKNKEGKLISLRRWWEPVKHSNSTQKLIEIRWMCKTTIKLKLTKITRKCAQVYIAKLDDGVRSNIVDNTIMGNTWFLFTKNIRKNSIYFLKSILSSPDDALIVWNTLSLFLLCFFVKFKQVFPDRVLITAHHHPKVNNYVSRLQGSHGGLNKTKTHRLST
jgi:hypothetical protein